MLGPGAVCAGGMPRRGLRAAVFRLRAPLWARRLQRPRPAHRPVVSASVALRPSCSGGGGVFVSSRPRPLFLGAPLRKVVATGFLSPRGNSVPLGVSMSSGDSTPLPTPWRNPPWVFRHSGGFADPSLSPTLGDSWATPETSRPPWSPRTPEVLPALFPRQPPCLPLCASLAPWRPCAPASSAAAERDLPVFYPPALASPCSSLAPLSCVPHCVAIRILISHSAPPPPCICRLLLRH